MRANAPLPAKLVANKQTAERPPCLISAGLFQQATSQTQTHSELIKLRPTKVVYCRRILKSLQIMAFVIVMLIGKF